MTRALATIPEQPVAMTITVPDTRNLATLLAQYIDASPFGLPITTDEEYAARAEMLKKAQVYAKLARETFRECCQSADRTHKEIVALREAFAKPADECVRAANTAMVNRDNEIRAKRQLMEQEQRRREMEAAAEENLRQLQNATTPEEAAELLEAPLQPIILPSVAPPMPKVPGLCTRVTYVPRVVKAGDIPAEKTPNGERYKWLEPDMRALRAVGQSMGAHAQVSGVVFESVSTKYSRGTN